MRPRRLSLVLVLVLGSGCASLLEQRADRINEQLEREIIALRIRNTQLTQAADACKEAPTARGDALYTELLQVFSGSEVQVRRDGPSIVVTVPGGLLFSTGSDEIREEAKMVVDLLSVALNLHPETRVMVTGHTDDRPLSGTLKREHGDNWGLSVARAAAFMEALRTYGVAEERFTLAGRGPAEPIADNATPEGRALNRRIVVTLTP